MENGSWVGAEAPVHVHIAKVAQLSTPQQSRIQKSSLFSLYSECWKSQAKVLAKELTLLKPSSKVAATSAKE